MAQTTLPFDDSPSVAAALRHPRNRMLPQRPLPDGTDPVGFRIGWDHARHGIAPPLAHGHATSALRQGWSAGRSVFAQRTLEATAWVRRWLDLRLAAWQQGAVFEEVQVTPHFIAQLQGPPGTVCAVTRLALHASGPDAAVLQRLNPQAAYAGGNLVLLHPQAAAAREGLDAEALLDTAQRVAEAPAGSSVRGLDARGWQRLALLASFATPLPHGQAASLPLVVLPPNRVRVINPVQALQVMLTLQFTAGGWARRLLTLAALMPSSEARHAFQIFMHTLLARRLSAGQGLDATATRQAMEDSWHDPLVQRRWQRLALWLTPADCEHLLQCAGQRGLWVGGGRWLPDSAALDGWALAPTALPLAISNRAAAIDTGVAVSRTDGHAALAAEPRPARAAVAKSSAVQAGTGTVRRTLPSTARRRGSQKLAS